MSSLVSILPGQVPVIVRNFLSTIFQSNTQQSGEPDKLQLMCHVKTIIGSLLQELDYAPPMSDSKRRTALEEALCSDFFGFCGAQAWFKLVCYHAAAMAQLSYSGHSFEIQRQISQFTWFMIYFDDLCHESPVLLQNFQRRIITGDADSNEEPILECFRRHLGVMYHFWDSIPANCITSSALEYINGCLIEERPSIRDMPLSHTAQSWPYYLRSKTGVSAAYAFMIFPSHGQLDISNYIQVIGDIGTFIDLVNDVLSFYKEYCAGEKHNYVNHRAFVTQKSVVETLRDVGQDIVAVHDRITNTLKHSNGSTSWKCFVNGYLAFHVTQTRYRLADLGF